MENKIVASQADRFREAFHHLCHHLSVRMVTQAGIVKLWFDDGSYLDFTEPLAKSPKDAPEE